MDPYFWHPWVSGLLAVLACHTEPEKNREGLFPVDRGKSARNRGKGTSYRAVEGDSLKKGERGQCPPTPVKVPDTYDEKVRGGVVLPASYWHVNE